MSSFSVLKPPINEKFIELCDEFMQKTFFDTHRANQDEIKNEWNYFKILLNNKMLEKTQISDYFSILREKITFTNKKQSLKDVPMQYSQEYHGISEEIYEIFQRNNPEINKIVYSNPIPTKYDSLTSDFVEEIIQKYR